MATCGCILTEELSVRNNEGKVSGRYSNTDSNESRCIANNVALSAVLCECHKTDEKDDDCREPGVRCEVLVAQGVPAVHNAGTRLEYNWAGLG